MMDSMKDLILNKAKERASRFGFRKTTMDEISADCGISKKTIYQHFTDKEDMFRNLVIRECQQTTQMLFAQIEHINDPSAKIAALIRNAVAYFSQDHFVSRILREADSDFILTDKSYKEIIDEEVIDLIVRIIRDGKNKGIFREIDEQMIAYAGLKLFEAFTVGRTSFLQRHTEQHYTEVLVDFVLNGIRR